MGIYDLHQHLWPEPFVRALERRPAPPRLRGRTLELAGEPPAEVDLRVHELDERLRLLDRHEIELAVLSLAPTLGCEEAPELEEAYDDGALELVGASGGRLAAFAAGGRRDGFVGSCVSAAALVRGCEPLLLDLEERGELLFVHPGPPWTAPEEAPAWWPAVVDYTAQMQAAYAWWLAFGAAAYPRLRVVFAILAGGAPIQLERLRSRGFDLRGALLENVYLETASYGRRALELCLATYGVRQLVHGSDAPVLDPAPTLAALRDFGEAVAATVLRENAARLLAPAG